MAGPHDSLIDSAFVAEFRRALDDAATRLLAITDVDAGQRPAPGKWSRKEIIGHLIDSAVNNHARFISCQLKDDLVFDGYDQDEWVRLAGYQEREWPDLVRLWQAANHHIANIMTAADPGEVTRPRARHALDRIAWRPVAVEQPATLGYFMRDYVDHLQHHLRQAFQSLKSEV